MFTYLTKDINYLMRFDYSSVWGSFKQFYELCYNGLYTIDVIYACMGYMMTFRFLDTHMRSVEPTLFGWMIALLCYNPFWNGLVSPLYIKYEDGYYWGSMLSGHPFYYVAWGSLIIAAIAVYSMSTVCLGTRFSNLTYRGTVTSGPYRYTKHPAYVAKCFSWWLISVPFIPSAGVGEAVRHSLLLCGLCLVYYWRARTEENHLSNYPEYVAYANWINEHGIFRWVGELIPALRYSEERCKKSGSIAWWKRLSKPAE